MTRFIARDPEDLLAIVPFAMGFQPSESVVLLTFGAPGSFHARMDLPRTPRDITAVVRTLLHACARNGTESAAVVVFDDGPEAAAALCEVLVPALVASGVSVIEALRADGHRWWLPMEPDQPGVAYDLKGHLLTAQRVYAGDAVLGSREELVRGLQARDPAAVERVEAACARLEAAEDGGDASAQSVEAHWVRALCEGYQAAEVPPTDEEVARLLLALELPAIRDASWCHLRRDQAPRQLRLWRSVLRRSPDRLVAGPSAVLAFVAWLAGEGALAWCAVDRCRQERPDDTLASLVADALQGALSPHTWVPVPDADLPLLAPPRRAG